MKGQAFILEETARLPVVTLWSHNLYIREASLCFTCCIPCIRGFTVLPLSQGTAQAQLYSGVAVLTLEVIASLNLHRLTDIFHLQSLLHGGAGSTEPPGQAVTGAGAARAMA